MCGARSSIARSRRPTTRPAKASARRCIALALLLALAAPAQAERLITTLSTSRVLISSNFTGADVVLFGSVERDAQTVARRGGYDIVVTVTGPRETVVTYRKQRVFGIWVNADSRTFVKAPSYLAVLSNRTINEIADIRKLPPRRRYGIVSQTTQPIERVRALAAEIARAHPNAKIRFADTVCKPTKDRQLALKKLIAAVEVIVVVGGRLSNNTRQLVETCRAAGKRPLHIERPEELQPEWFRGVAIVGLTGGTSTLPETVEAVRQQLEGFHD